MTYQPQPVETSKIVLSADIQDLTEELAEHAHEVWAKQRIADGWTYGPTRNDTAKQHPCLVPYAELSDGEKQYDRNAALETLKVIQALGYRIVGSDTAVVGQTNETVRGLIFRSDPEVADLLRLWQDRDVERSVWKQATTYVRLAQHFMALGVPYSAREVAEAGLAFAVGEQRLRLRHLTGLAWARCGVVDAAAKILCGDDLKELPLDEELRGLEAALQKQIALQARTLEDRTTLLRRSRDLYRAAWKAPDGSFWTGINVASLHLLLGEFEEAACVAREIEQDCLKEDEQRSGQDNDDPYWRWATLGEACLNQRRLKDAEKWYCQAGSQKIARNRIGHLNSTRRQLRSLLESIGEPATLVDDWLPIPRVAIFTGHRIDDAERAMPRFPSSLEPRVAEAISKWLIEQNVRAGVCSAANGGDILFLEALQSLEGSDSRIVLPFAEEQFIRESVNSGADESWVSRFKSVLKKASRVTIASSDRIGAGSEPFDYANRICLGQALKLQKEFQSSLLGLAVWDGQPAVNSGGTADCIERWRQQNLTVYTIDLSSGSSSPNPATALPVRCEGPLCDVRLPLKPNSPTLINGQSAPLMSMLFADVVGFSKLNDAGVELFIDQFLKRVADCIDKHAPAIAIQPELWHQTGIPVRETWGDGLYFALTDIRTAGLFALELCDKVSSTNWKELGFEEELQIRIALHCGPVHLSRDPITGLPKCTGTHVSRAARLEPKTPPNHVYASDAFASLCEEEHVTEFSCEFVKLLDWAKHYGTYPTYVVQRR